MNHERILLIEDDKSLSRSLDLYLKSEGFEVETKETLKDAHNSLQDLPILILLDWTLPDGQGIDFLKELRKKNNHTPIIMLTAKADLIDKVLGLETGANDYLTKPFEPRELLARIRSLLRTTSLFNNAPSLVEQDVHINNIKLNKKNRLVTFHNELVELTKMEYHLICLFLENPNKIFSREELLNEVWGYENYPTTRTVDNHILQLRQKFNSDFFETVRGIGYRFRA